MMKRIIVIFLAILMISFCMSSCTNKNVQLEIDDLYSICELATIEVCYNNVAKGTLEKDNIFQKDRDFFIEYEGVAILGIDMAKLKIDVKKNVVNIDLPNAEILSIEVKRETLNNEAFAIEKDGFLFKNKITFEDQENAVKEGQAEMEEAVKGNAALILIAENKAKKLLTNYINEISKATGQKYTINWQ